MSYSLEVLLRVSSISLWFYAFRSMSLYDIITLCTYLTIAHHPLPGHSPEMFEQSFEDPPPFLPLSSHFPPTFSGFHPAPIHTSVKRVNISLVELSWTHVSGSHFRWSCYSNREHFKVEGMYVHTYVCTYITTQVFCSMCLLIWG